MAKKNIATVVAQIKAILGFITQDEADARYPQISEGDPTPIYTADESDARFSRRVLSSNVQTLHTGTTAETTIFTGTISANLIGVNGRINCLILEKFTNNANNKIVRIKINGTTVWIYTSSAVQSIAKSYDLVNRNSLTAQVSGNNATNNYGSFASTTNDVSTYTFNTAADLTVTVTVELTNASDSAGFEFIQFTAHP